MINLIVLIIKIIITTTIIILLTMAIIPIMPMAILIIITNKHLMVMTLKESPEARMLSNLFSMIQILLQRTSRIKKLLLLRLKDLATVALLATIHLRIDLLLDTTAQLINEYLLANINQALLTRHLHPDLLLPVVLLQFLIQLMSKHSNDK